MRRLVNALEATLYPPICAACGDDTADPGGLCPSCFAAFPFILGPVCDRCGAPSAEDPCRACAAFPPAWRRGRAAALHEGPARRAALMLKYGDRLDLAPVAAGWMARAGAPLLAEAELLIPVPLHWRRFWRRRFNQAAELARALSQRPGTDAVALPDALIRRRATPSQEGLSRAARAENMRAAFAANPSALPRLRGARVALIDDVMTTGATLGACAEALLEAGAKSADALTLCRVAAPDWEA